MPSRASLGFHRAAKLSVCTAPHWPRSDFGLAVSWDGRVEPLPSPGRSRSKVGRRRERWGDAMAIVIEKTSAGDSRLSFHGTSYHYHRWRREPAALQARPLLRTFASCCGMEYAVVHDTNWLCRPPAAGTRPDAEPIRHGSIVLPGNCSYARRDAELSSRMPIAHACRAGELR